MKLLSDPQPGPPPGRLGWGPFLPLLLALLLCGMAGLRNWGSRGENLPYLGALIVWVSFLPALGWWTRRGRAGTAPIPFLPVIGLLFGAYFGWPLLVQDSFDLPTIVASNTSLHRAAQLALYGWLALGVGWACASPWVRSLAPVELKLEASRTRRALPWLLGLGLAAMFARRTLALSAAWAQPILFLETLFQLGLGILAVASFRRQLGPWGNRGLWLGLVPAYLFFQVGQGSVAQLAYAALFVLFLAWGSGRRVPILALGFLAASIVLLRGHVHAFRSQTWYERSQEADAGVWQRSFLFVEIVAERLEEDGLQSVHQAVDRVTDRISHIATLAHVVEKTPRSVPFWNGATYASLSTTIVPRILWPEKPPKETGQDFGHRYGLLHPTDKTTAINCPQLVELYANFGARGVLVGMFLLGVLYRIFQRLWNTPGAPEGTLILGSVLFSRLVLIESDFSLVFGGLLQRAVLLVLVLGWLSRRSTPQPVRLPLDAGEASTT